MTTQKIWTFSDDFDHALKMKCAYTVNNPMVSVLMADESSKELFARYRDGDSQAATAIFNRYVARLISVARNRLSRKLRRRLDPEDVVQSAYRSFFLHARQGDYALQRAGDLWRLLVAITLNKLHRQVETHSAAKRSLAREQEPNTSASTGWRYPDVVTTEPSPDEAVAVFEQLQRVMVRVSATQRRALELRLQGRAIAEIAVDLGRSQRTVRRLLESIRADLEAELRQGKDDESRN